MNLKFQAAGAAVLAASLIASYAQAADKTPPPARKTTTAQKAKTPPPPSVADQIQALRQELEKRIDKLESALATKDTQLKQAQQTAAEAQAAIEKLQAASAVENKAVAANAAAVGTLQSSVADLKSSSTSADAKLAEETAAIKKSVASPDALNFKGVTVSLTGSFVTGDTVYRSAATGGGINTPMNAIPLQNADAAKMSEFLGSSQQSRLAIKAVGKTDRATYTGYYELDFLAAGVTSNNNQSNSYMLRQRQIWFEAALKNGWRFSGGQMFTLATEYGKGIANGAEILPTTIDPQYNAGFVWGRQYGFRVTHQLGSKFWLAAAAENAQTLNPGGNIVLNTGTTFALGASGALGGLYNNQANYSYNVSPDFVVKAAFEPGWGHYELFGIERNFRDRIYATAANPRNASAIGAGIGGSFRGLIAKKLTVGAKGLWGQGVGRYGNATIADVTVKPTGELVPLHGFSALGTVEYAATPRLTLWSNYGGDTISRRSFSTLANVGYGSPLAAMSGCNVEVAAGASTTGTAGTAPANCAGNTKDVQELSAGYWFNVFNNPKGRFRQGIQYSYIRRDLWSGAGGTTNPGGKAHGADNMIFTSFRYFLP